tara:strand:+ start:1197 stop:1658 length:462 start_codon:yes stop_codon:yes gene_type:complete
MSHLSRFNNSLHNLVADLKKMGVLTSDVVKLETFIEITHVNARTIISNFQQNVLRDVFVSNILSNNIDFFLNYDPSEVIQNNLTDSKDVNYAESLIGRVQELVIIMRKNNNYDNINKTFDWIKILCFHAYSDIGIDAVQKFKDLQKNNASSNM